MALLVLDAPIAEQPSIASRCREPFPPTLHRRVEGLHFEIRYAGAGIFGPLAHPHMGYKLTAPHRFDGATRLVPRLKRFPL
jgi:hypothetical protein